jgi:Astacin (Peptidase family M12A)
MSAATLHRAAAAVALACTLVLVAAAHAQDPGERTRDPRAPRATTIIEGDIEIPVEEIGRPNPGRWGTFQPDRRWPNGVVPFATELDPAQFSFRMAQAQTAMNRLAAFGGLTFVPRTNQGDYIIFRDTTFNSSPVGKQGGGQPVNVVNWDNVFVIGHELLHAVGFWHEQSRNDRNTYVTIDLNNVCQSCCEGSCNHNFNLESGSSDYGPYDFDSLMHYGQCDFASTGVFCPPSLVIDVNPPWEAQWQSRIGQRNHFSQLDSLSASFLYALPNWRFADVNAGGGGGLSMHGLIGDGSFLNPWRSFADGAAGTPSGGRLFVQPGTYQEVQNRYTSAMRIEAPLAGVRIEYLPFASRAAAPPAGGGAAMR